MSIWNCLFLVLLAQRGGEPDDSLAYYGIAILLPLGVLGLLFFLLNKFSPENHRKKKSDLSRQERWKFRIDAAREAVASGDREKARKHWLRAVYHGQKIGHESQELRQAEEGLEALGRVGVAAGGRE